MSYVGYNTQNFSARFARSNICTLILKNYGAFPTHFPDDVTHALTFLFPPKFMCISSADYIIHSQQKHTVGSEALC